MSIKSNTFAEACYNMNSIEELEEAMKEVADETDMKTWNITAEEWREQIELALSELREDTK